jgi:hypothetical protein
MMPIRLITVVGLLGIGTPNPAYALQQDSTRAAKNQEAPRDAAPDSAKEAERRLNRMRAAENRALFASREPVKFTLIANYGAISRDRDTLSTKRFAGTIVVADSSGAERRIPVQLRTRGHFRLRSSVCRFAPMRIDFPDSGLKNTPFAGQESLKLGSHCQNDGRWVNYLRREYLANRLYNVLTDVSLRVRMAEATYVDSASGKIVAERPAILFENEDEAARRIGGKIQEWRGAVFADLHTETLLLMSIFEYAIGNTDWSIFALHNVRLAALPDARILPIAYDFDFSGLVNTHYAVPDPRMGIRSVRDRLYRGPCVGLPEVLAVTDFINGKRDQMLAAVTEVPGMTDDEQKQARTFLDPFFRIVGNRSAVKQTFVDGCDNRPGV